jgi:hypothetical protein
MYPGCIEKCPPGGQQSEVPCAQTDRVFLPYGLAVLGSSTSTWFELLFGVQRQFDHALEELVWGDTCEVPQNEFLDV